MAYYLVCKWKKTGKVNIPFNKMTLLINQLILLKNFFIGES